MVLRVGILFIVLGGSLAFDSCCRQKLRTLDCSFCGLTTVPRATKDHNETLISSTLLLNNNNITYLPARAFAGFPDLLHLSIRNNPNMVYHRDSFLGLHYLYSIDLRHAGISFIPAELLAPLTSLHTLKLDGFNPDTMATDISRCISSVSSTLKVLQLPVPLNYTFGMEYSKLKLLERLAVTGSFCTITHIKRETFQVFAEMPLKVLEVNQCFLQSIAADALINFRELETLNFACNYHKLLEYRDMFEVAKNLPRATLKTLIVDGSGRKHLNQIEPTLFNSTSFQNLTHLSIRDGRLISVNVHFLQYLPNLEHLNIGFDNVLSVVPSDTVAALNYTLNYMMTMHVKVIDLSNYGIVSGGTADFRHLYCWLDDVYSEDFFQRLPSFIDPTKVLVQNRSVDYSRFYDKNAFLSDNIPPSINYIFGRSINLRRDEFVGFPDMKNTNILYADMSRNSLKSMIGSLGRFERLQGLDVNSCELVDVDPKCLEEVPTLTYLNLSHNSLTSGSLAFLTKSSSLKTLDLSYNFIDSLYKNLFVNWTSLEWVSLKRNNIRRLDFQLSSCGQLRWLDFSSCALPYLQSSFMEDLDRLQSNASWRIKLEISGNPLECSCSSLPFLRWFHSTNIIFGKQSLTCLYANNTVRISEVNVEDLAKACDSVGPSLAMVVSVPVCLVLFSLAAFVVAFHFRWTLKWRYYLLRRRIILLLHRHSDNTPLLHPNKRYHAFVSHNHSQDYEWVIDTLLARVEESWNLRLCVGQRDFVVGVPIAENICDAIDNSMYTILVVTPGFVESEWCEFEMHMALTRGHRHLIILYKELVAIESMSKTLRSLMKSINYIEYNETEAGSQEFWMRLHDALVRGTSEDSYVL